MRVLQTEFFGDHNIGILANASDKLCVLANHVPEKRSEKMEEVLGAKVLRTSIANSGIVGIFCALNSNGVVIPGMSTDMEVKKIKEFAAEVGMSVGLLGTRFTALGNLILCNDKGAVISNLLSDRDKKEVEDCLGVEAGYGTAAGLDSIGSCGVATNKGCVMHRDSSEEELDNVQELLHVDADIGTANFGSPFVGSCCVASSKGIVVGESTTGPEVTRMMEALSLL